MFISIVINLNCGKIMKFKDILIILSCLLVATVCIGSVAAIEDGNFMNSNSTQDSESLELSNSVELDNEELSSSDDEEILSDVKYIDDYGETYREMSDRTVRNAIKNADAGDTLVIKTMCIL